MQPIPTPVKNVTVWPYYTVSQLVNEPLIRPVIEGAAGTYSVGTLVMSVFYNLSLEGEHPLELGRLYVARAEDESGEYFETPPMHCLSTGPETTFGRTITLGQPGGAADAAAVLRADHNTGPYIVLGPLTDVDVTYVTDPPPPMLPLVEDLILGGRGHIIGTRVGTPHLMGVAVRGGERFGTLQQGLHNVSVTAKNAEGHQIWRHGLTVVDAGDPAILLQTWPPRR